MKQQISGLLFIKDTLTSRFTFGMVILHKSQIRLYKVYMYITHVISLMLFHSFVCYSLYLFIPVALLTHVIPVSEATHVISVVIVTHVISVDIVTHVIPLL